MDRIEHAVAQAAKQIAALKSEVATLVSVTADIKKRISQPDRTVPARSAAPRRSWLQVASAVAGVAIGVLAGIWYWEVTSNEPLALATPVSIATEPAAAEPPPTAAAPITQAAIVPVASVTPSRNVLSRETAARVTPQRADYVGTLSIDSDPPGKVFIDRTAAGQTPMRAANLKAGSHLIWIERDGYRRFTRVVQVPADRITRLVADLEPTTPR